MITKTESPNRTAESRVTDREVIHTRLIDAPRERVFDAFADAEGITNWWGPNGFRTTTYEKDVRADGVWRFTMHGPDGTDYPNFVRYTEVVRPERLAWEHGVSEDTPPHFTSVVTLTEQDGKTRLEMRSRFPSPEALELVKKFGAVEGGQQTLDRLEEYLNGR